MAHAARTPLFLQTYGAFTPEQDNDKTKVEPVHSYNPIMNVYKGQAIRELSECLWGRRYLDGFGQHEILELIECISVL